MLLFRRSFRPLRPGRGRRGDDREKNRHDHRQKRSEQKTMRHFKKALGKKQSDVICECAGRKGHCTQHPGAYVAHIKALFCRDDKKLSRNLPAPQSALARPNPLELLQESVARQLPGPAAEPTPPHSLARSPHHSELRAGEFVLAAQSSPRRTRWPGLPFPERRTA